MELIKHAILMMITFLLLKGAYLAEYYWFAGFLFVLWWVEAYMLYTCSFDGEPPRWKRDD